MWTKIISHRLAFLVGVLVTALLLAALQRAHLAVVSAACPVVLAVLWFGLTIAGLAALNARSPETFLLRDGAFTTPPSANAVLLAATSTMMPIAMASVLAAGRDVGRFEIGVVVLMLVLAALQWYDVSGPFGTFLRPDGVLDRQPLGSLFVPWEAVGAATPTTSGVKLRITHPELVVRRGLRPGATIRTGADRGFTAWAISLYATQPSHREAIGTADELLRLEAG
jgi:hypothetical protein